MRTKEPLNLYRMFSIVLIVLGTFGVTALFGLKNHFYVDEWLCLFFIDIIFRLIYIFKSEHERNKGGFSRNTQNNFLLISGVYVLGVILTYAMSYLPEFCKPVMFVPLLMCAVSNITTAVSVGLFCDILLVLSSGGNVHALMALVLLTLLAVLISEALEFPGYRWPVALISIFINLMVPSVFYYLSYKEMDQSCYVYGLANGVITGAVALIVFGRLRQQSETELDNLYLDIVSEDYSEVKALKDFSLQEYQHAKKVSDISYRCAEVVGCDPILCLAAGFYYRMGRWMGEPYTKNVQRKTTQLGFPDVLSNILIEYYGEEKKPSSPESALVHMVDALVIKFDALNQNVGDSAWNRDILIYQTLNEFSASGLYDESGMSMNQFLKIREFLAKEEILQ